MQLSSSLLNWLAYPHSLTARLKHLAGTANVVVLAQKIGPPLASERAFFNQTNFSLIRREIIVYAEHVPCWYARTLIPQSVYQAHQSIFNQLEHCALGDLIFEQQLIQRQSLDYFSIADDQYFNDWSMINDLTPQQMGWMRHSTLAIAQDFFHLFEIPLPGLLRYKW